MLSKAFTAEAWNEAVAIIQSEFGLAVWETLYVTVLATALAIIIGLPLGVLLVAGEKNGVLPLPKWFMTILGGIINILR